MAYNGANLNLQAAGIGGTGMQEWTYISGDASATVRAASYITDGGSRGMRVGDLVKHYDTGNLLVNEYRVVTVSSTSPGAVDLSDATVIGSASNT